MSQLSNQEKARRVSQFRKIIVYRFWAGWLIAVLGPIFLLVAVLKDQDPLIILNGFLFLGYGVFMIRQSKKATRNLNSRKEN